MKRTALRVSVLFYIALYLCALVPTHAVHAFSFPNSGPAQWGSADDCCSSSHNPTTCPVCQLAGGQAGLPVYHHLDCLPETVAQCDEPAVTVAPVYDPYRPTTRAPPSLV